MKTPYDRLAKIYTNCTGHMTKMATTPIYGKNSLNILFSGTKRPISNDIPPQIKILNMVIPILMRFCSFVSHCSIVNRIKLSLYASVYMCFGVTCWGRADLLALVCGVYYECVAFPLVSWVKCGT